MNSNKRDTGRYNGDISACHVIGLTGGIGTGKSTAAEYLVSKGFRHIDADAIGRELTADGSSLLKVLDDTFGRDGASILDPAGSLDRKALADIVFTDPKQKQKLDDIMFSRIEGIIRERIAGPGSVLLDAPLLFEAGLDALCDKVILITCDPDTRMERVVSRDNTSREKIDARIRSQMSDDEKRARADYIVDNSGSIHGLRAQLDDILSHLDK